MRKAEETAEGQNKYVNEFRVFKSSNIMFPTIAAIEQTKLRLKSSNVLSVRLTQGLTLSIAVFYQMVSQRATSGLPDIFEVSSNVFFLVCSLANPDYNY